MNLMQAGTFPLLVLLLAGSLPALAGDWPHWRGAARNGVVSESSGWNGEEWLSSGPAWQTKLGEGAASPLVVAGKLYGIGWNDGQDVVRCLDAATGKEIWKQSYPSPRYGRFAKGDQGFYRGATATPEYDPETAILYTLSCDGSLNAWNTREEGTHLWGFNLYERFGMERRPQITSRKNTLRDYGYTCAPLVAGDQVIVETGDREGGCLKGFDKRTGKLLWASENRDPAGHSGGIAPITVDGVPCVAVATSWNTLVVRIDGSHAGETVAAFEWKTDFSNTIAGIVVEGQDLLISSRYNQMAMVRLHISLEEGATEVWRNGYPTGVCTPVIHNGSIYFANKGIHCVDFETGELRWEGGKIGDAGSCYLTGDERLVVWGNSGDLFLVEGAGRSPDGIRVLAEKRNVYSDMAWPHVAGADGRLYCRTVSGDLACFALAD